MLGSEVLAFDHRFSPVNPKECRMYWCSVFVFLLEDCLKGSLKVGFVPIFFKFKKLSKEKNLFLIKLKEKEITFFKKDVIHIDVFYIFWLLMSFFPLPKPSAQTSFVFPKNPVIDHFLKEILKPNFIASSWTKQLLFLLFPPTLQQKQILPRVYRDHPWIKWLKDKSLGRRRFYFHSCSVILIRTEERLTVHVFHRKGGHITFSLPRTKETYRGLYVLFHQEKQPSGFFCFSVATHYKSYTCPSYVELLCF